MEHKYIESINCCLGTIKNDRDTNQDKVVNVQYFSKENSFILLALCDGIGGMLDGGICANKCLSELSIFLLNNIDKYPAIKCLELAIDHANQYIYSQYNGKGGTTLSLLFLNKDTFVGVNIGDSRIYEYCKEYFKQISVDDTIEGLTGAQHYLKGLLQYVGMGQDLQPHVYNLCLDKSYILMSDGVYNSISIDYIKAILDNSEANIVDRLLLLSNWVGGKDNASLIALNGTYNALKSMSIIRNSFITKDRPKIKKVITLGDFIDGL